MISLKPQPLDGEAFSPFGFVAAVDGRDGRKVNQGRALRLDGFGALRHEAPALKPILSLYAIEASKLPLEIALVERHPLSSQVFVPMQGEGALVVVAPNLDDGAPDIARAMALIAEPGQAICYHPGTWHAPLFALEQPGLFTMMMWQAVSPQDCEEFALQEPVTVVPD